MHGVRPVLFASEAAVLRPTFLLAALSCLLSLPLCPAAAPPARLSLQIARWIDELGDDSFAVREEASKKLRDTGAAAEPALEKAAASKDAEVSRRARNILADFQWGIYPDTPDKVVGLIRKYRSSSRSEKGDVIRKLFAAGSHGCRALVKIARSETDELVRKDVFADLAGGMFRSTGVLLDEGNLAALEGLLQLAVEGDAKWGVRHYAAYYLLTGQLPKRIAELEERARKNPPGKVEAEVLAYLYRAQGDLARAAKAAEDAEKNELVEAMLYEAANWKELARRPDVGDMREWTRYVGSRAAYARLAGNTKLYESAIKDILDRARPIAEGKGNVLPFAKALFLNARPAEALELLKKADNEPRLRFEVLASQYRFKDAFAVVDAARAANSTELPRLEILQARVLHGLGEKERALAILTRHAEHIKAGADALWYVELVDVAWQIGRYDDAFAYAAKVLEVGDANAGWPGQLFEKLFLDQEDEAAALWRLFRRADPKQPTAKALARLRTLLDGKASAAEIDALMRDAGKEAPMAVTPEQRRQEWLAAGEAARLAKQLEKAAECFRKAGGARGEIHLGDLLAARKQWQEAAAHYRQGYRLALKETSFDERRGGEDADSLPALALFLHGDALVKAGQGEAGRKAIDQAHLLPLGSGEVRYYLAKALVKRHHREAAAREHELLRRLGEPNLSEPEAFYTGEGMRAAAITASARKQYLEAADGYEQAFLRCLNPTLNFARPAAYVTVPAHIYNQRARGLALAGKMDEALVEAQRARAALPGSADAALELVPLFEHKKRTKDADELYRSTQEVFEGIMRDYPRSAWACNQAAWLSACCRRDLEKGLAHARKAVTLAPSAAGYIDTLGEVLFQLGKKDEALAAAKKALALDPKRAYYRKQLKRIEAGDPKAPRPEEDE
jgi:tetratricopeptide (TPR) repeat protein